MTEHLNKESHCLNNSKLSRFRLIPHLSSLKSNDKPDTKLSSKFFLKMQEK